MLIQLLSAIDARSTVHLAELSEELGVTVPTVQHMLSDLTARGLLSHGDDGCATPCGGCAFASSCQGDTPASTWQVTARGRARLSASRGDAGPTA